MIVKTGGRPFFVCKRQEDGVGPGLLSLLGHIHTNANLFSSETSGDKRTFDLLLVILTKIVAS